MEPILDFITRISSVTFITFSSGVELGCRMYNLIFSNPPFVAYIAATMATCFLRALM